MKVYFTYLFVAFLLTGLSSYNNTRGQVIKKQNVSNDRNASAVSLDSMSSLCERHLFKYNNSGKQIFYSLYQDCENEETHYQFGYDTLGRRTSWIYVENDTTYNMETLYTYDSIGHKTVEKTVVFNSIIQKRDTMGETFFNRVLDANKRVSQINVVSKNRNAGYPDTLTSENIIYYDYDSSGNLIKYRLTYFDQTSNKWTDEFIYEYMYDSLGRVTSVKTLNSEADSEYSKVEYTYDLYGNLVAQTFYNCGPTGCSPTSKSEFRFDLSQLANNLNVPYSDYGYFNDSPKTTFRSPEEPFLNKVFVNKLIDWAIFVRGANQNWIYSKGYTFYYTDGITALPNDRVLQDKLRLFPNPTTDIAQIENLPDGATCTLFDSRGVAYPIEINTGRMDIAHLNAGIYTLRIISANSQDVIKVVKR